MFINVRRQDDGQIQLTGHEGWINRRQGRSAQAGFALSFKTIYLGRNFHCQKLLFAEHLEDILRYDTLVGKSLILVAA